jgi:lipoyl(octanoyl) transferase
MISLLYLGRVDYGEALALQQELTERRKRGLLGDVLLLLEHPPVLTMGRNAHREHILATEASLKERGIAIFETNRGGDVTYHGPGQLVGYPILDLRGFTPALGAIEYVRKLEEVIVRACGDYGILTGRVSGRTGVWTGVYTIGGGQVQQRQVQEKKIAAIGVHISRGVTSHGFAVNVTPGLDDFQMIVPCGISDRGVTSIEAEIDERIHRTPTLEQVANSIARHFARVFAQPVLSVESLQELLGEEQLGEELLGRDAPARTEML